MRVAVIGAGMAGLGAARTLRQAGIETVIFEKSRGIGGRVATRRVGPFTFDHGASIISPRGATLENVMLNELPTDELVLIEKPIYLHVNGRVSPVDPEKAVNRYGYKSGINKLGKLLGEGLDIRLNQKVESIARQGVHYIILGERFSHAILTPPLPQTAAILQSVGDRRTFPGAQYRKTLSVMFGIDQEIERPYHALLDPNQSQPLTWLSIDSVKIPGHVRAPAGQSAIVVQMSARYSRYSFERSDDSIFEDTWFDVRNIVGLTNANVVARDIQRWAYSHAANTVSFESANNKGERLALAGDGFSGARIQQAFDSGIRAAELILETP